LDNADIFDMRNLQKNLIPKWSISNKVSELIEELPNLCNNFEYQVDKGLLPNLGEYSINSYEYDINDFLRNPNNKCFKILIVDKKEEGKETNFFSRYFVITSSTFIILVPTNEKYKHICKVNYVGELFEIEEIKEFFDLGEEYKDLRCFQIKWNKKCNNKLNYVMCAKCNDKGKSVVTNIRECLLKRRETLLKVFKYIQKNENVDIKTYDEIIQIKEKMIENKTNEAIFEEINYFYQKIIEILSRSSGEEFTKYLERLHKFIDSYDKLKIKENKEKELLAKKEINNKKNVGNKK
jgi:hypothetical protein